MLIAIYHYLETQNIYSLTTQPIMNWNVTLLNVPSNSTELIEWLQRENNELKEKLDLIQSKKNIIMFRIKGIEDDKVINTINEEFATEEEINSSSKCCFLIL